MPYADFLLVDQKRIDRFNLLLKHIKQPLILARIADIMTKSSPDTVRLDCKELARLGYMVLDQVTLERGRSYTYVAIKDVFDIKDYIPLRKKSSKAIHIEDKEKNDDRLGVRLEPTKDGTIIRLTTTTHWTPRPQKTGKVYIASTFNMV